MEINYFEVENKYVRENFDLEKIIYIQSKNDVQIIRGEDYQYCCYINKICITTGLTPMYTLSLGCKIFELTIILKNFTSNNTYKSLIVGHRIHGEYLPADEFRRLKRLYIEKNLKKLKKNMSDNDFLIFKNLYKEHIKKINEGSEKNNS